MHYGEKNCKSKINDEELDELYKMLMNNKIPYAKIQRKFNLSRDQLRRINMGKSRYNSLLNYPLRKYDIYEERALKVIELLKTNVTLTNKEIGEKVGIRGNEVSSINNGKKYAYLCSDQEYPIRKIRVPVNLKEKQRKANIIRNFIKQCEDNNVSWTKDEIKKKFGFNDFEIEQTIKNIYPYSIIEDFNI